jgi:hypothetical protein
MTDHFLINTANITHRHFQKILFVIPAIRQACSAHTQTILLAILLERREIPVTRRRLAALSVAIG